MNTGRYFISYSSRDDALATVVCDRLEAAGFDCWMAPRDVEPGAYAASIVRAIRASRAMIFLASEHSANSGHVSRELERAVDAGRPIVPVRIDPTAFSDELNYYLAGMHWLDVADKSPVEIAEALVVRLHALPADAAAPGVATEPQAPGSTPRRRRGVRERILTGLLTTPPPLAGLALSLGGILIAGVSFLLGFGEFTYVLDMDSQRIEKEVGYLWAFNWSVAFIFVYPAIAAVGLQALREANQIGDQLSARCMAIDQSWRLAEFGQTGDAFRKALHRAIGISLVTGAILIAYACWEFYSVVGHHYFAGAHFPDAISIDDPYQERDWSVAALLTPAHGLAPPIWPNFAFSAFVYLAMVGFGASLVLGVFICFLAVTATAYGMSGSTERLRLTPDLREPVSRRALDPRCGFELFQQLIQLALLAVALSFCALYLIHLQNLYLRAPDSHILDYLLPADASGQGLAVMTLGGSLREAISNLNSAIAYLTATVLFAGVLFGLALTLRISARQGRAIMLARLEDPEQPLPEWLAEYERTDLLDRLDEMRLWPAKWPRLNHILAALALAATAFVFVRIGFLIMAAVIAFVLWRALSDK